MVPRDQFDNLNNEEYQTLIRERVTRGEIQAHHADTNGTNPNVSPMGSSISIPPAHAPNPSSPDASSTVTGVPTYPTPTATPHSVLMAIVNPNSSITGTTTSSSMDTGPHTLLRQLMSNTSAHTESIHGPTRCDTTTPKPRRHINVRRCRSNPGGHTDGLVVFACSSDASEGQSS